MIHFQTFSGMMSTTAILDLKNCQKKTIRNIEGGGGVVNEMKTSVIWSGIFDTRFELRQLIL